MLLLTACSGSEHSDAGGPRFLIASTAGLTERDGGRERTLLSYDDGSYVFDPDLSPDGKRIAFIRQPPASVDASGGVDFGADLYIVDSDGRNPKEIMHHSRVGEAVRNPIWLSDTELLINIRGRGPGGSADLRIELLDLAAGVRRRLVNNAVEIALSPDRKKIAYVMVDPDSQREQLTVADLHTTEIRALTPPDSHLVFITSITWSSDGSRVAFAAADPTTGAAPSAPSQSRILAAAHPTLQDIWLVSADGSNLHRLSELAESQPSLAWATDSSFVYAVGVAGFWRVDPASGALEVIGQGIPFGQIRLLKD